MIILCFGYRSWAINIYSKLAKIKKLKVYIFKNDKKIDFKYFSKIKPDYVLFYGWSWKVKTEIINNFRCIMLHPSKLPNFRGGSPLQNQIIRNIKKSAVTLFRMNNNIDSGNIILQKSLDLSGEICDIFSRIEQIGYELTKKMLSKKYFDKKQNLQKGSVYKRRKPSQSQITLNEIKNKNSTYLINKIRMLGDPYPNAYIKTKDNKKIILKKIKLEKI